jgi:predicted phage terminase large subunit-like protein
MHLRRQIQKRLAYIDLAQTKERLEEIREKSLRLRGYMAEAWSKLEPGTKLVDGWHLDAMAEHLEAVTAGQINRLLINVPPGSSKSMLTSVLWPTWEWGPAERPFMKYLATSFSKDAILRDNRKHRNLVLSEWYQTLWPDIKLARKADWSFENTHTGGRLGSAYRSLTSKRADRLLLDDPHSTETAESDVERGNAVRIFREGALDRLNDQDASAIVVVMQRLHERDVAGTILDEMKEQGFVHLNIPMRFEPERKCYTRLGPPPAEGEPETRPVFWEDPRTKDGELMCEKRWSVDACDKLEEGKGPYGWAGQYQQRPAPREGGMFKPDQIEIVEFAPPLRQSVRGWDMAASVRKTSPYTVGLRLGLGADGIVYITDIRRARVESEKAQALMVATKDSDGMAVLQSIPQDPGQAGKALVRHLAKALSPGNCKFSPETGSKEHRAIPLSTMVNIGLVKMVKGAWNQPFIDELRTFPAGAFKDQVDAASRAYAELTFPRESDGLGTPEVQTAGQDSAAPESRDEKSNPLANVII